MISVRTLAVTRYRRNHEFMNEVFMHAAFGNWLGHIPHLAFGTNIVSRQAV